MTDTNSDNNEQDEKNLEFLRERDVFGLEKPIVNLDNEERLANQIEQTEEKLNLNAGKQKLYDQIPTRKIYNNREIRLGTFLGGPLVAGYFIAQNFKVFSEAEKVKKTWIYAIIASIVIFGGAFLIPDSLKIPNFVIPLIYVSIASYLVNHFQGQKITAHIKSGGQIYSWWRTIGVALIGLAIIIIPIFSIVYFSDTETKKTYDVIGNTISFDKSNIQESETNKLAYGLAKTKFFDQASAKYVYAKKFGTSYALSISCSGIPEDDSAPVKWLVQVRKDMQTMFPSNKIIINLFVDDLHNVVKQIE